MINCKTPIQKPKNTQAFSLPDKLNEILPLCKAFQKKPRNAKIECDDWHVLCHQHGGFTRWLNQQEFPTRFNAAEFSALSARAYLALAELDPSQIPHFAPLSVTDVTKWAHQGKIVLPRNIPLPGAANNPLFWQGLADLQRWKPRDLPKGTTGHGDPVRRWLINRLLEEFYFSFALAPSLGAIRDIVRLVWSNVDDKTLRRYVTDDITLKNAKAKADTRRDTENISKAVSQQIINRSTVKAKKSVDAQKDAPKTALVELMEDEQMLINATRDDEQLKMDILELVRKRMDELNYA